MEQARVLVVVDDLFFLSKIQTTLDASAGGRGLDLADG